VSLKSALVTGGAGFIGSHLVERLLSEGASVVVLDDLSTGSESNLEAVRNHPRLRCIYRRISEYGGLPECVAEAEVVFHLAAAVGVDRVLESPLRAMETNLHETEAVLRAASVRPTKVLLASSSEVYGTSDRDLLREDQDLSIGPPTVARWSYACSKLLDEFLALAYGREQGLPVIIARLFNTIGPRQSGRHGMVLPRFIASARSGKPLRVFGTGQQTRCFCDVADTIEALVRLQSEPRAIGEIVNVGSGEEVTILEVAELVVRTLRSTSSIELVPYELAYRPGFQDLSRRRPDLTKLKQLTGFVPGTSLEAVVRRVCDSAAS